MITLRESHEPRRSTRHHQSRFRRRLGGPRLGSCGIYHPVTFRPLRLHIHRIARARLSNRSRGVSCGASLPHRPLFLPLSLARLTPQKRMSIGHLASNDSCRSSAHSCRSSAHSCRSSAHNTSVQPGHPMVPHGRPARPMLPDTRSRPRADFPR